MTDAEYQQMREEYAKKLGVTVEQMEAYARSIVVLGGVALETRDRIELVAKRMEESDERHHGRA